MEPGHFCKRFRQGLHQRQIYQLTEINKILDIKQISDAGNLCQHIKNLLLPELENINLT